MRYRFILYILVTGVLTLLFGFSTTIVLNQIEASHMTTAKLHLVTAIEFIENSTASFFENEAIRVSDWSSDGFIRDTTERLSAGKNSAGEMLGEYIRTKKMPLDHYVLAAEVVDENGVELASTLEMSEEHEVANHLAEFEASTVSKLSFGENAFLKPTLESHSGVEKQMMVHFLSPLFSLRDTTKRVGFLIIHVRLDSFFSALSERNIKTTFGDPDLYLFDRSGAVYLPRSDSHVTTEQAKEIVRACEKPTIKDTGFIQELPLSQTIGALMCPSRGWWIPYLAVNSNTIMEQFMQGRTNIAFTFGTFFFFTILVYGLIEYSTSKKIVDIIRTLGKVSSGDLKSRVMGKNIFFSEIILSINNTIESLQKSSLEQHALEERVVSLDRVKNEFVSIAAHQIRNPITTILAAAEELREKMKESPEESRDLVSVIRESTKKLNHFISFLLSATRAENGPTKFHLASFDLKDLTQEVIASLHTELEAKDLSVEIAMVPEPLPYVYTDMDVLRQVIQNFLSNAARYSHSKGKIEVKMVLRGASIEYSVKDFGIGIPAAIQNRIFGKFFRAENAKKEAPEGTGLGLSFSKSLVESWGGQVWFESEENKGSTFYVTIPVVGVAEAQKKIMT